MIRKLSHITISLLLLILTMGFSVSKHYCGNALVEVSIFASVADGCSGDGSCAMESSCCHNELQVFQLDEDYSIPVVTDHVQFIQQDLAIIDLGCLLPDYNLYAKNSSFLSDAESPPPPLDTSTFLSAIQSYLL